VVVAGPVAPCHCDAGGSPAGFEELSQPAAARAVAMVKMEEVFTGGPYQMLARLHPSVGEGHGYSARLAALTVVMVWPLGWGSPSQAS
jgi:hypothetical protein